MNKKLAIKGHPTRGKEVIEILKMMGGRGMDTLKGNTDWYMIDECENNLIKIYGYNYIHCHNFITFTLEEFLEKYPFKVGDKIDYSFYSIPITVKSMSWSEDYYTMVYDFFEVDDVLAAEDLVGCKKVGDTGIKLDKNVNMNIEFDLIKYSYEVKDGKLVISEKKPKYPDNYEECVRIAKNIYGYDIHIDVPAYGELMESFVKLIICRDAYWKIAGVEMGLGKPWEPDWDHINRKFYCIYNSKNNIVKNVIYSENKILAFPTEEMRDAFYENFKDLIESCKELL